MKCQDFMERMDAFVDGEIDEGARLIVLEHARVCESCAKELKLAKMVREAMLGSDAEIVVPLAAQASWRSAVKAAALRRRMGGIYRKVGALAAAAVVMIGVVAGIQAMKEKPTTEAPRTRLAVAGDEAISEFTFVEPDGNETAGTTQPVAFSAQESEMNASVKLIAGDIAAAAETVKSLALEFNGHVGELSVSPTSAYVTAYIPSGELEAFIKSLEYAGTVDSSRVSGEGGDTASVSIAIKGEE